MRSWLLVLVGCKGPPEAPAELEDLCAWLYTHIPDEDPTAVEDGIDKLEAWLVENFEDATEGYEVHNLDQSTLDQLDDRKRDADAILGAAVASRSSHGVGRLTEALILADQTEVFPETYETFERTFDGDAECFVAGDCERIAFENDVGVKLIGDVVLETVSSAQDLWVHDASVLLHRSWTQDPSSASVLSMEAQYNLAATFPHGDTTYRLQAVWADAEVVGLDLPDGTVLNMLVKSLQKGDETLYEFVSSR